MLPRLREVWFNNTQVSRLGMATLRRCRPGLKVVKQLP
jgi:hypothetical protein